MVNEIKFRKELDHLRAEHQAVENQIAQLIALKVVNQFEVQKLKKHKLELKDKISQLEAFLVGDIVA
jgi:hypothetical protein